MAINVSQAFHRTSANPIDDTLALTKAEMVTVNDNLMPSKYLTVCQDDGLIYLYAKSNSADPNTGKFRVLEAGGQSFVAVNELPTTDIRTDVIYLVPKEVGTSVSDVKDEYINLDGTTLGWECIGSTSIDLSDYVTNTALENVLADYTPTSNLSDVAKSDNVEITDLANGDILKYDSTKEKFVNVPDGDASLISAVTSNLAVGAIASGTTLPQGTTFTEFAQKLLITEIAPNISFSLSKSGNVVYGGSYTETLTVNVSNMGTAKKIKTIAWYEGDTLKQTDTIDSTTTGSWTYTMGTATTDTTTFKAIITYTKSNDADDTQTKTASINFYYNKFYGAVSDLNPTEATVEALSTALGTGKGGTYSFTTSASRMCYAYPKSLGALTSIKDGNGFSLFNSFTRTEQTYTQNGTSVVYYRYVLTDPATVSGYSVIFA